MKIKHLRFPVSAMLLSLTLLSLGCASSQELTLTSVEHHQAYRQGFTQAYINHKNNGDTDVVLIDRAAELALNGSPTHAPVRQIMHLRIVWSPTRDMKAIVSNAAVKWYVIGQSSPQEVLEYSGIAFVSMNEDDESTTLKVQNALLKPSGNHGTLTDPIGPSRLEGTFVARPDATRVNQVLENLKTTLTAANGATPAVSSARPE